MNGARLLALVLSTAAVATAAACSSTPGSSDVGRDRGQVVSVTDGDTLRVLVGGEEEPVRLLGIDGPETRRPGVGVECGGRQATGYMRRLVLVDGRGYSVRLESDPGQDERDRFDRRLGYVSTAGGDVGVAMVRAGWAKRYVFAGRPVSRDEALRAAERQARAKRRGVWGRCAGDFHRPARPR